VIFLYPGASVAERSLTLEDVRDIHGPCEIPQTGRKHSISSEPGLDVKMSIQATRPLSKGCYMHPPRIEIQRSSTDVPSRRLVEPLATYKRSSEERRYSRLNEGSIRDLLRQQIMKVLQR
jgi:hypothetical protein